MDDRVTVDLVRRTLWVFWTLCCWSMGACALGLFVSNGEKKLAGTLLPNSYPELDFFFTWWGAPVASCIFLGLCFLVGIVAVTTVHAFSSGLLIGNWAALLMALFVSYDRWRFVFGVLLALPVTSYNWMGSKSRTTGM